jgi:hypothetical protein
MPLNKCCEYPKCPSVVIRIVNSHILRMDGRVS